jgi:hypothetical protein
MKPKIVWFAHIPGIFGYGICVLSDSKEGAMKTLRDKHSEWVGKAGSPHEYVNDFDQALEHFAGGAWEVELNRAYYDDFGE